MSILFTVESPVLSTVPEIKLELRDYLMALVIILFYQSLGDDLVISTLKLSKRKQ